MKKSILACAMLLTYSATYADDTQTTPAAATSSPATSTANPSAPAATPATAALPTPETINCTYHTPNNAQITYDVVKIWAEKAIVQSFDYNNNNIDFKLQNLKPCFTEAGWIGYTTALDQSGNLAAIRTQKLTVSSQIDGQTVVNLTKENQWKVVLPIQVVYQNQQDKVTQLLNIEAIIARKISGDLGIQQIIASPRKDK